MSTVNLSSLLNNTYQGEAGFVGSQGYTGSIGFTGSKGEAGFGSFEWIIIKANYTANAGEAILADTTSGAFSITLPASPLSGDAVTVADGNDWSVNNLTILAAAGDTIEDTFDTFVLNVENIKVELIYDGSTWQVYSSLGKQGDIGYTGSQGTVGFTGSTGFTGSQGVGFTGSQGDVGFTGSRGDVGFTGSHGDTGFTGSQGSGFTGSTGFTGSSGYFGWITVTSNYTAIINTAILANSTGGPFTITLPAQSSIDVGDTILIVDGGNASMNEITVSPNGTDTIEGLNEDLIIDMADVKVELIYDGSTWQVIANIGPPGEIGFTGSTGPIAGTDKQLIYNNNGESAGTTQVFYDNVNDRLGIYTNTPSAALDISSTDALKIPVGTDGERPTPATGMLRFNSTNTAFEGYNGTEWGNIGGELTLSNDTTTNSNAYYLTLANNQTTGDLSSLTVSSSKLYFNPSTGQLNATFFNATSDARYKENIQTIDNSVDIVNQLNGVSFTYKDSQKKSYGVIAQELETVLPELVSEDHNGIKSVTYDPMIALLIENIKVLNKKIQDLEKK